MAASASVVLTANTSAIAACGTPKNSLIVWRFGNAGFPLAVGEVGIADFDQRNSPYGWHIVKRLK